MGSNDTILVAVLIAGVFTIVYVITVDAHVDQTVPVFTDIRLNGGSTANQGRVEVLIPTLANGWFPLCQYTWSNVNSMVLCNQLGYHSNAIPSISYPSNSDRSVNVYFSIVCQGNEPALSDCSQQFQSLTTSCNEINVVCSQCQTNSVRLRGGLIPEQGSVEVCINGGWTGVCGVNWDYKDAFVVCRQLGLPATDILHFTSSEFGSYYSSMSTVYYNCFGNETQLISCRSTSISCSANRVAGVYCRGNMVSQECGGSAIRLANGRDRFEGRVEICSNGLWGTVHDGSRWDYNDARVICRQLFGSSGNIRINYYRGGVSQQLFGHGTGPIALSQLNCNGNERDLFQCPHFGYNFGATHVNGDVGVRCLQTFDNAVTCTNGDVRLVNGSAPYEGRVEMCYNRVWGSVCDSSWDNFDASVVCRQLGYQGTNATALLNSYFGEGSGPYHLNHLGCNGHEGNLIDCSHGIIGYQDCQPGNDAGVRCDGVICNHGDVRLFGGYSDRDGVAEVCINGYWGDICDNHWDSVDATVFCNQLFGEDTFTTYSSCCLHQRTTGNVTLASLNCATGSPNRITDCSYSLVQGSSSSGCTLHEESLAGCYDQTTCTTGDVRLVNGHVSSEGRVEMCHSNVWGTLPTEYWRLHEAESTCQQLGLPWDWAIPVNLFLFGRGKARFISFTGCTTTEQSLINCSWSSGTQFVPNSQYRNLVSSAGVICQGIGDLNAPNCEENDVRLVNGTNELEGRVEICAYGSWVTMCDNGWRIVETQTVCKHLGYPSEGSFHIPGSPFGVDYSLPIAGQLSCTSETTNVGECQLTNRTTACHYGMSIGVVCQERTYYNVSIEVPQGPIEIGSVIQLNCTVTPQPDIRTRFFYWWNGPLFNSPFNYGQNITITVLTYHPANISYYCHVYSGSSSLLGGGRKSISIKGLLHPSVPTSIMAQYSETVTLQVNTTYIEVRHYLRELAWYHNGQRLIPNEHMLLSEDNKTLTILNTTDEDSGVYEAMFEGLLVYPHNRYCERVHINLLRYHPILSPVVFHVNSKGLGRNKLQQQGLRLVVEGVPGPAFTSRVIPFTNGDNITLTGRGFVSKSLEVEHTALNMFWFHNGQRISSPLSSLQRTLPAVIDDNLNVSQSFTLTSGDFSDAGVYEVQLVVDMYSSFYHHTQCRPYYNTFVGISSRFGSQYITLSHSEIHLRYVDMLSFSLDVDKPSITQEESATITCSASIKYPPLTTLSLVKAGIQLAMTSEEVLQLDTRDIRMNLFGTYMCDLNASGVELQRYALLKEEGYLHLEFDIANETDCHKFKNMTSLIARSLASKMQNECRCNFTVEAFVNSSVTCSGNKMSFETTVEFSTNDGHETASSVINRIVNQVSYSTFFLTVNGLTLMVTRTSADQQSDDKSAKGFSSGAVGGTFIGGLLTGIVVLCTIAAIVIVVLIVRRRKSVVWKSLNTTTFTRATNTRSSTNPPTSSSAIHRPSANPRPRQPTHSAPSAKPRLPSRLPAAAKPRPPANPPPSAASRIAGFEVRYTSRANSAPMRPLVTKPSIAYVKQAPRVKDEVEQEVYEDIELVDEGGEAIYEETDM